jgi:signal transduction histidine kinase
MVVYQLIHDRESLRDEQILAWLDESGRDVDAAVEEAAGTGPEEEWKEFQKASDAFREEARLVLAIVHPSPRDSANLFRRQEDVMYAVRRLMASDRETSYQAQRTILSRSAQIRRTILYLLAGCLAVIFAIALGSARIASRLFERMEWQANELSRVSGGLLETQEDVARRFSHELHDELGQALTAIRANLSTLRGPAADTRQRIDDCLSLVDNAISDVREMSQLLHPRILDDFGLPAGLRWLCERLSERTGLAVEYVNGFEGRLSDHARVHMFRIAQEALTNITRHSRAKEVTMRYDRDGDDHVLLAISDDGVGISPSAYRAARGHGLVGMRARARLAGGFLALKSQPGRGTTVEARVPIRGRADDQKDQNSVG